MEKEEIVNKLQAIRNKEVPSILVQKEQFLMFREILMEQEDKQSFRGNAQHKGNIEYTYEPGWTK
ncbi:hypothetical protein BTS2_3684 [Bacillus sp. TS-2]|nr:hypothetical protein BTS2_3684 [Bacillus sp. TS-2]